MSSEEISYIVERSLALASALHHAFSNGETNTRPQGLTSVVADLQERIPPEFVPAITYIASVVEEIHGRLSPSRYSLVVCALHFNIPPILNILPPCLPPSSLLPPNFGHHAPQMTPGMVPIMHYAPNVQYTYAHSPTPLHGSIPSHQYIPYPQQHMIPAQQHGHYGYPHHISYQDNHSISNDQEIESHSGISSQSQEDECRELPSHRSNQTQSSEDCSESSSSSNVSENEVEEEKSMNVNSKVDQPQNEEAPEEDEIVPVDSSVHQSATLKDVSSDASTPMATEDPVLVESSNSGNSHLYGAISSSPRSRNSTKSFGSISTPDRSKRDKETPDVATGNTAKSPGNIDNGFGSLEINFFSGQTLDSYERSTTPIGKNRNAHGSIGKVSPLIVPLPSASDSALSIEENIERPEESEEQSLSKKKHFQATSGLKALLNISESSNSKAPISKKNIKLEKTPSDRYVERRLDIDPSIFHLFDASLISKLSKKFNVGINRSEDSFLVVRGEAPIVAKARDEVQKLDIKFRKQNPDLQTSKDVSNGLNSNRELKEQEVREINQEVDSSKKKWRLRSSKPVSPSERTDPENGSQKSSTSISRKQNKKKKRRETNFTAEELEELQLSIQNFQLNEICRRELSCLPTYSMAKHILSLYEERKDSIPKPTTWIIRTCRNQIKSQRKLEKKKDSSNTNEKATTKEHKSITSSHKKSNKKANASPVLDDIPDLEVIDSDEENKISNWTEDQSTEGFKLVKSKRKIGFKRGFTRPFPTQASEWSTVA